MTTISSGGSRTALVVSSGTTLVVLSGGLATSTSIAGTELLSGGVDSSGTVVAGGAQVVSAGGMALAAIVDAGAAQTISTGGLASSATVGGTETVLAGGTTSNTMLENGLVGYGAATENVLGRAVSTTVSSGGTEVVLAGGVASATVVAAYGMVMVSSGGSALSGSVAGNGSLHVLAGGRVTGELILGSELLMGGTDSGSTISGQQTVGPGGRTVSDTVAKGGHELVGAGGVISASLVRGSVALSGGAAAGVEVANGGSLQVSGGSASGTLVAGGGSVVVSSGTTSGTVLLAAPAGVSGAVEQVLSGGSADGTRVGSGAQQIVAGGLTTGTVVLSGGSQSVGSGGALNDLVAAGGTVYDGAVLGFTEAQGTDIAVSGALSGSGALDQYGPGTLTLAGSLSAFSGAISIYAGTLELTSAAAGPGAPTGTITFGSGSLGVLQSDQDAPANVISGFVAGDTIDLASLATPAAGLTVATSGNTVTLLNANGTPDTFADGSVAQLTIAGASGLQLGAESDGSSGTDLSALATVTTTANGGASWQVTALANGSWVYTEQPGTSTAFSDGGFYSVPDDTNYLPPPPSPLPSGQIVQSGPGTLVLPGYEAMSYFNGTVVIAGGTVKTTAPAGAGITSFSFAAGTSGTLLLTGLEETTRNNGMGLTYSPATFTPVSAIGVGDVIDLGFLPFTSALGIAPVSSTATTISITSGGQQLVLPSTTPQNLPMGVAVALPVTSAGAYTYQLSADGTGGTDITVTGNAFPVTVSSDPPVSGQPGPPFGDGSVSDGGATYNITDYNNGDVGVSETSGTVVSFTSSISSGASLIQSGAGTLDLASSGGAGAAYLVIGGGILEIGTPYAVSSAAIAFASGTTGILQVDAPTSSSGGYNNAPSNVISGFTAGDELLLSPNLSSAGPLSLSIAGDIVTLTENGQPLQETQQSGTVSPSDGTYSLDIVGASGLAFNLVSGAAPGQYELTVPCYCAGTLILTGQGERPVESLAIADLVLTVSGALRPIRWVGRRSYSGRLLARRRDVQPVLIHAGALGDGLPRRDLRVSPDHAMLLDGLLVPARLLVNGVGIVRDASLARVDYVHLELDSHDAILAEGAASETFVDDDSRLMFHNASEFAALYPAATASAAQFCAPRVESGYALERIRQRLSLRAAS